MIYASYWRDFKNASFSLSMIYSEIWGCYKEKEGHNYFYFTAEEEEESRSTVTYLPFWMGLGEGRVEKNPALACAAKFIPEQLDFTGVE